MKTSETQNWERVRAKGRASFIWRVGVLGRGLTIGMTFGIILLVSDLIRHRLDASEFLAVVLMAVGLMLLSGLVHGISLWQKHERDYEKQDHVA